MANNPRITAPSIDLFAFNTAAVVTALAWNDAGRKVVSKILGEPSDTTLSVVVFAVLVTAVVLLIYYSYVFVSIKKIESTILTTKSRSVDAQTA